MAFLADRFAGDIGAGPGENMAPDHGYAKAAVTSPPTRRAFLLPSAPPGTTSIFADDLPPAIWSVETIQPAPNLDCGAPSCSKSLIQPDSDPFGGAPLFAFVCSSVCLAADAFQASRSIACPAFQTATMLRVRRMSLVGSPSTSTRSALLPAAIWPRSSRWNAAAAAAVAPWSASAGVRPARTISSNSPWMLAPCVVPGL